MNKASPKLAVWGFTGPSAAKEILVDDQGRLIVGSIASPITAEVDKTKVWDGTNYLEIDSEGRIGISNFPTDYPDSAAHTKLDSLVAKLGDILTELQEKVEKADLSFDASGYLNVDVKTTINPPNLNVALSTRASESTLSSLTQKFADAVLLSDTLSNPTTTIIGSALLGYDGSNWRRVRVNSSGYLVCVLG